MDMHNSSSGTLVISLDLELYWGMRDIISLNDYQKHLQGVHQAIPAILELFKKYKIHATWATVGFLYCVDIEQLQKNIPSQLPSYTRSEFDPYQYINTLKEEDNLQLHFCPDLIELIKEYAGQEIGTHTFSHYYCLETGQTPAQFKADLNAAIAIAKKANLSTSSLVFPRNQYNSDYLALLSECGIDCYRGNETSSIYHYETRDDERPLKRILRLLDAYLNLTGQNCHSWSDLRSNYPINIPSSRFLRPYFPKFKYLDGLRLRRITSGLEYAANHGLVYHLWWHPHNFGVNLAGNLNFLEKILQSYQKLNTQNKMQSLTMGEIAKLCMNSQKQVSKVLTDA
jgi:peptidoglycan/xylan/chitin deacetylase (PgdA/CDA1 family)